MKSLVLCITLFMGLLACNDSKSNKSNADNIEQDTANYTTIQWIDSAKNIGMIQFGDKVNIEYTFKNTGSKPLYIIDVEPTCGCTVADYTQNAVMPGNTGVIKAQFNSSDGIAGVVNKTMIVTSNTKNDRHFVLTYTGTVVQ